jgi:hypothetical protein
MKSSQSEALPIEDSNVARAAMAPRVWRVLTLGNRLGRLSAVVLWLSAAVGIGLFFGWSWVVAAGLSSVVLAALPCAAMCAAGLCMGSGGSKCADPSSKSGPSKDAA